MRNNLVPLSTSPLIGVERGTIGDNRTLLFSISDNFLPLMLYVIGSALVILRGDEKRTELINLRRRSEGLSEDCQGT